MRRKMFVAMAASAVALVAAGETKASRPLGAEARAFREKLLKLPDQGKVMASWTHAWDEKSAKWCKRDADGKWVPREKGEIDLDDTPIFRMTGRHPYLHFMDFREVAGTYEAASEYARNAAAMTGTIREAWRRFGSVPVFSWHLENPYVPTGWTDPKYGGGMGCRYRHSSKDYPQEHRYVIREILTGTGAPCGAGKRDPRVAETPAFANPREWYLAQLRKVAAFLNGLKDDKDRPIPCVVRFFHEMEDDWMWWGPASVSAEDFKAISRMTAEMLIRDVNGGENLLFLYSPDRYWKDLERYMTWYPGDDITDIMGFDDYSIGATNATRTAEQYLKDMIDRMRLVSGEAQRRGKVCGIVETGRYGAYVDEYYACILKALTAEGVRFSFCNTWGGVYTIPKTPGGLADWRRYLTNPKVLSWSEESVKWDFPGPAFTNGPRTTVAEFLGKYVDTSIPALSSIPAAMAEGRVADAEKTFADYVRGAVRARAEKRRARRVTDPKRVRDLAQKAESVMAFNFSTCGTPHHFPCHRIDWEANPTFNGYHEWTWQLSRHDEFCRLAASYLATGDERIARAWTHMLGSWFDQAQVPLEATPYQTACWRTIEAGIRMAPDNWPAQLESFIASPEVTDDFIVAFFRSVREHGWRLINNPTRGNWLVHQLMGLVAISELYPFLGEAPAWKAYALRRFAEQGHEQVYPDGFQIELTTGYHAVVMHYFYALADLYRELDKPIPEFVIRTLGPMCEAMARLQRPDRCTPALNDGGPFSAIGCCRKVLGYGVDRPDFRWFATEGREGRAPGWLSTSLPYAGMAVFRSSWDRQAVWGFLEGGPFGLAHQHEDKLNFLLSAYGKEMLTEGGTYAYDTSDMRRYVVSTRGHNTVRFDGLDQNRHADYRWRPECRDEKAKGFSFVPGAAVDVASAVYDEGYGPKKLNFIHRRTVRFVKDDPAKGPYFAVEDEFTAPDDKPHAWEAIWHLETCDLRLTERGFDADFGDGVRLAAEIDLPGVKIADRRGSYKPDYQGWKPIHKGGPHEHRPVPTPVFSGTFSGKLRTVTTFRPYHD